MKKMDLIDKYVQNKASAEELDAVKRLLKEDAEFKSELSFQMGLREAIKRTEGSKIKQYLQGLDQASETMRLSPWVWRAAAVLVLAAGLAVGWFFNGGPNYQRLYVENFEPYPNFVAPLVRSGNMPESQLRAAFLYYDEQDYARAAAAFKAIYENNKIGYANFYYGVSLMADYRVEEAMTALENPEWQIPENFRNATYWYLGLGYLKLENKEKARASLKKVAAGDSVMSASAETLLNSIE